MNTTDGALSYEAILANAKFRAGINEMIRDVQGLSNTAVKESQKIDDTFSKLGRAAAGYFAFTELSQLPQKLIQVRGEFQQLEIAFTTMLGNKAKADKLLGEVVQLAAQTPFGLKDAANATKQLLAYGSASQDVVKELRMLGDVSAGISVPIGDLTYLYGTLRSQGRAYAVDIRQFAGRGIPIYAELAKVLGTNVDKVNEFVEQGKVGFPEVEKAFKNMTGEGGMFFNLMEKQSKSLTGLTSQLKDAIEIMFNDIGKSQEAVLGDSIKFATLIVQNYEPLLDVLTTIVATYGAYRAAIIATAAVQALPAAIAAAKMYRDLALSIHSAADAQIFFNLVTKANPYVIAATALVTLVTAVALFRDTATEAQKAQQRLNGEIEKSDKVDIQRKIKVDQLKKSIQDETKSQEERKQKLQELIALSPRHLSALTLENIATDESTKAIEATVRAMKERMVQQNLYDEKQKTRERIKELKSGSADKEFLPSVLEGTGLALAQSFSGGKVDLQKEADVITRRNREQAIKELEDYEKTLVQKSREGIEARRQQRQKAISDEKSDADQTVKFYTDSIKSLQEQQETASSNSEYKQLQKQIDALDAKRRAITGELTKEQQKYKKDADKIGPFGSISYWEEIARKAQEVIDKTPGSNTSVLSQQMQIKTEAEKKAEDIRKLYAVKSFEEEIALKKQQYELYQRWVDAYGKKAADEQFKNLVAGNESYLDYINSEIRKLQSLNDFTPLNQADSSKLDLLNTEKNRVTGKDSGIELFNKQLIEAEQSAGSLSEALDNLAAIQSGLGTPKTEDDFEKLKQVSEMRQSIKRELQLMLSDFLVEANANGAKVLQIEKRYLELKVLAQKNSSGDELEGQLKAIELKKNEELDAIKDVEFEQSDSYKKIYQQYLDYGRKQIKARIADIDEALKKEKLSIEERKKLELLLANTKRELNKDTSDGLKEAAGILDSILGDTSINISKSFSISFKQISAALNDISTLMDSSASTADQVGSIVGIITFAITSARDAMLKASDLATAMDAQVENYQNLANELEGINYLLERQRVLLDDLKGVDRAEGVLSLYDQYAKQQEDALTRLQQLTVDTIASQKEIFVDPVFNTKVENKGFGGFWTNLMTGGKAKTKIEYQFESVDTSGFQDIEDYINLLAEIKRGGGKLYGKEVVEADVKALEDLINTYNDAVAQQKELMNELKAYYTGTTEEGIVDSIVQGFIDGKRSAMDFAEDFEQMMLKAVQNSLKANLLDADMKAFYDKFSEYSLSDYTLTDAEIAELKALYNKIIEDGQKKFDQIEAVTGVDLNGNSGSAPKAQQGVITGASQESVNILEGQITAMRIIQADHLIVARSSLFELAAISKNTQELYAMRQDLAEIRRALNYDWLRSIGGG
ncbi:tape measure protein [Dyadobacter bucti]|uniref:tape measure protein n=1 Tax=Dyadobacter bucti TaxID=2572203 RepID=UPI0011085D2E|nr:tape measure protein [Dyadobacter bucti]